MSNLGRFAPSPSGRLHMGSLLTAYASYLRARSIQSSFILRLEDLDLPRCKATNLPLMLRELMILGLHSDSPILVQSHDLNFYYAKLQNLYEQDKAYYCSCTRASLKTTPCSCSSRHLEPNDSFALRTDLTNYLTHYPSFIDHNLGPIFQNDFSLQKTLTLLRSDHIIAYNLAVVLDDHRQGVSEIVRGADMLEASFLQLALYEIFGYEKPHFLHIPLLTDESGNKLSKQNHAPAALASLLPVSALLLCLKLLQQGTNEILTSLEELEKEEALLLQDIKETLSTVTLPLSADEDKVCSLTPLTLLLACEQGQEPLPLLQPYHPLTEVHSELIPSLEKRRQQERTEDVFSRLAKQIAERRPQYLEKGLKIYTKKCQLLEQSARIFNLESLPKNSIRWYNAPKI